MVRRANGEVVPIPTVTASVEVPPRTIALLRATRAFFPIAVMFASWVACAIDWSRDAW